MGLATYSCESVTLHNALETLTLGSTDDVYERAFADNVSKNDYVAEFELCREVGREFDQLAVRCGSCLFKMPFERGAGVLFCHFVIGKLNGGITIFLYRTNLRNNTRTSLNDGAWNIFSISTENGSHSDFLSN